MIFEQIEVKGLSHFSYIVGCETAKEIAVIDPKRDIDTYLLYAKNNDLTIRYILETHIHADFASGALELQDASGGELLLSAYDKGEKFEVKFPHTDIDENSNIELGSVRIEVLHTPGHTPEHVSFLVYDKLKNDETPEMMLSGDFIFVGSVGRPDLLGEDEKRNLAAKLWNSITTKLENLPDELKIYPAHGAGSLCGAGMGKTPHTTLGAEKISNPYLNTDYSPEDFTEKILASSPPFPEYYKLMKKLNSDGPPLLGGIPKPAEVTPQELEAGKNEGAFLLDVRHPLAFGGGHVPGSLNIESGSLVSAWAPWVIPYDKPVYIIAENPDQIEDTVRRLIQVGLDNLKGMMVKFEEWTKEGREFESLHQTSVTELHENLQNGENNLVLDVRSDGEWKDGHIENAEHIFLGYLAEQMDKLPQKDKKIYTVCGGGYRSSLAASILLKNGYKNIINTFGGMGAWKKAELPVIKEI